MSKYRCDVEAFQYDGDIKKEYGYYIPYDIKIGDYIVEDRNGNVSLYRKEKFEK